MENKKYINKIEIIVDGENDFDNKCEYFIETLNEKYDLFNKRLDEEKEKWDKAKIDKNKCFIEPENIKYKSPITIFEGKWGIGKTRFLEHLILKTTDKDNIIFEKFNKIGIIDLWEFSSSKDIACDILEKFYKIFFPELITLSTGKKFLSFLIKFGFKKLSQWPLLMLDKLTNKLINSEKIIDKFNKFVDDWFEAKKIKKLNDYINEMKPIIIIFENLERLEVQAYEIVKLIQRISMIPNLMIIISVNKSKLFSYHKLEKDDEHWINKYSTLGNEYSFKQTYTNFLINNKIDIQKSLLINEILMENKNLNIRYLNNKFNNDLNLLPSKIDNWFNKSKYHGLIYIYDKLELNNFNPIKKIINSDKKVIVDFLNQQKDLWIENVSKKQNIKNIFQNFGWFDEQDSIRIHTFNSKKRIQNFFITTFKDVTIDEDNIYSPHHIYNYLDENIWARNIENDINYLIFNILIHILNLFQNINLSNIDINELKKYINENEMVNNIDFDYFFRNNKNYNSSIKNGIEIKIKNDYKLANLEKLKLEIIDFRDKLKNNISNFIENNNSLKYWFYDLLKINNYSSNSWNEIDTFIENDCILSITKNN